MQPWVFRFESMGTFFEISIWDKLTLFEKNNIQSEIISYCHAFDQTYSRFIKNSLVTSLSKKTGVQHVPKECVDMLRIYNELYLLSNKVFTPLVGNILSDLGYDSSYSLIPKKHIRNVPPLHETISIIDDTHIVLHNKVIIDFGALGKGFAVDHIESICKKHGLTYFLINGSGDILYKGKDMIEVGLEHPDDPKKIIGSINFTSGAMCSSAGNRRSWGKYHHIINPMTKESAKQIRATWVIASCATIADALATALFLVPPDVFTKKFDFDYLILDTNLRVKRSSGFAATLY